MAAANGTQHLTNKPGSDGDSKKTPARSAAALGASIVQGIGSENAGADVKQEAKLVVNPVEENVLEVVEREVGQRQKHKVPIGEQSAPSGGRPFSDGTTLNRVNTGRIVTN